MSLSGASPDNRKYAQSVGRSGQRPAMTERRKRRAAFQSVMDFLHDLGYHVEHGWGDDSEVAYHGGHTLKRLAEMYGERDA